MKFLHLMILITASAAFITSQTSFANENQFFCRPLNAGSREPLYIAGAVGVCVEEAECAFVPPTLKNQITSAYRAQAAVKAGSSAIQFESVPEAFTAQQLRNYHDSLTWHSTRLACRGSMSPSGPICPSADHCKADRGLPLKVARVNSEVESEQPGEPQSSVTSTTGGAR